MTARAALAGLFGASLAAVRLPFELLASAGVRPAVETSNRFEAFGRFAAARPSGGAAHCRGCPPGEEGWLARVAEVSRRPSYEAIWTVEGLGHRWGAEDHGPVPAALPERARIPFHTGFGLALATRAVEAAGRGALERFAARARSLALPGYDAAVREALGVPARVLHPARMAAVAAWADESGEDDAALYWHGVGRGHYFAPTTMLAAGAASDPLDRVLAAVPARSGEAARDNLLAGYAWAVTLVNVRDPGAALPIVERLARERGGAPVRAGAAAALAVWRRATGEPPPNGWGMLADDPGGDVLALFRFRPGARPWRVP